MDEYNWPEITVDTPIEELQRIHKDIWEYIIRYGVKPKTQYMHDCVACEYAYRVFRNNDPRDLETPRCVFCPIDWGCFGECGGYPSIYKLWLKLSEDAREVFSKYSPTDANIIAVIIRDIPFKHINERSSKDETANENP